MAYYIPTVWKSGGRVPRAPPPNCAHVGLHIYCTTIGRHTLTCNTHDTVSAVEHWGKMRPKLFAAQ